MTASVLIKNGRVMDGSGGPSLRADVLIRGDRIEDVGLFPDAAADRVVDAAGLAVAPGFIDAHSHLDFLLPSPRHVPVMEKWVRQGVATVVAGNCGFSPAPLNESFTAELSDYWNFALPRDGLAFEWSSMAEFLDRLDRNGLAVNAAIFTGHNVLRAAALDVQGRFAAPAEIGRMQELLRESLTAGSIGLSIGLYYYPGVFSHTDEITELASVLAEFGAPLATHTRGISNTYADAVAEVIGVAEKNGIPLQLSHHAGGYASRWKMKTVYGLQTRAMLFVARLLGKRIFLKLFCGGWTVRGKAERAVAEALERGVEIGHDNMPWACGPTTALAMLPPRLFETGVADAVERLGDPEVRRWAAREIKTVVPKWPNWENNWWTDNFLSLSAVLAGFRQEKNKQFEGATLKEVARELKKDPYETFFDLVIEERGRFFIIDGLFDHPAGDDYLEHLLEDPRCSIMTDIVGADFDAPNPVPYGAFAKVLGQFARDRGVMAQEEAVRRMTSLPAKQMRLKDRGWLKKGACADVTIFNPQTIRCRASFKDPHHFSEGVEYVFINGRPALDRGVYRADALAGKVIRRA